MLEVSSALKEWALQEMGFQSQCSAEELSSICSGPMADVWRWIIQHAKRRDNVKMIKGNVALTTAVTSVNMSTNSTSFYDSERKMMMDDRSRLMGELHSVLMKTQRLKSSLASSRADLVKVDNRRAETTANLQVCQHRVSLLKLYHTKANNLLSKLSAISSKLKVEADSTPAQSKASRPMHVIDDGEGIVCEAEMRLQSSVAHCSSFFKDLLLGNMITSKTHIKDLVSEELKTLSPQALVQGIILHSNHLEKLVTAKMKSKENVQLDVDEEEEDPRVESVAENILSLSKLQTSSYKSMLVAKKNVEELQARAEELGDKTSSTSFETVRINAEVESLRKSFDRLQLQSLHDLDHDEYLTYQQHEIDGLCQVISSLINKSSSASLNVHQLKILEMMSSTIPVLANQITTLSEPLTDVPSLQLKALNSAPTWKLSSTKMIGDDWMTLSPTSNLSIYRNCNRMPQTSSTNFSSKSDSLGKVVDSLSTISKMSSVLEEENQDSHESRITKNLDDLEKSLSTNIKEQRRNLVPVIDECKARQKKTTALLGKLKTVLKDWRDQPAMSVAMSDWCEWGEVEGRSLEQSLDLTKYYLTKLS